VSTTSAGRSHGVPVRRYLVWVPVMAVTFVVASIVQEWPVFRDALGLAPPSAEAAGTSEALVQAVRRFDTVVGTTYATGSTEALSPDVAAPEVVDDLRRELAFAAGRPHEGPLALASFSFLRVDKVETDRWTVSTEETWANPDDRAQAQRLRYRYLVARFQTGFRVEAVDPVLPEPDVARAR